MKRKAFKKALSSMLALTIVCGAPVAAGSGMSLLRPAIEASAASQIIEPGVAFFSGDTVDFGNEGSDLAIDDIFYEIVSFKGKKVLDKVEYDAENGQYVFSFGTSQIRVSSENIGENAGLKVQKGSGAADDPYKFTVTPDYTVSLETVSASLDDCISLNFYAYTSSKVHSVKVSGPNADIIYTTSFTRNADNKFSYPLYATQLGEDITIEFLDSINRAIEFNGRTSFTYSINDYCDKAMTLGLSEKDTNAVKSLRNLGLAADNYFSNGKNNITFMSPDDNLGDYLPLFSSKNKLSLVLDSKFAVRHYIDGLTADSVTDDNIPAVEGQGGKYCFEINSLKPTQLASVQTVSYNGKDYNFSALGYCARALANDKQVTKDLGQAVYEYYKYVKEYTTSTFDLFFLSEEYAQQGTESISIKYTRGETWADLAARNDMINIDSDGFVRYGGTCIFYYYVGEHAYYEIPPEEGWTETKLVKKDDLIKYDSYYVE